VAIALLGVCALNVPGTTSLFSSLLDPVTLSDVEEAAPESSLIELSEDDIKVD